MHCIHHSEHNSRVGTISNLTWHKSLVRMLLVLCMSAVSATAVGACRTSETESNGTDATANAEVCSGVAIAGSLSSSRDLDWYRLDITGAGTISISLAHGSTVDFDWFLYPATGAYVAYASTSSNPETGSYNVNAAGTYYLRVKSYRGSGNYTLTISGPLSGGSGGLPVPTLGAFSVPTKIVSDAPFTLNAPSSNSGGAFSYASSNLSVASISGSTVTVVGAGTATITATQAATATYATANTSTRNKEPA